MGKMLLAFSANKESQRSVVSGSFCSWDSPGVDGHILFQGIFPTQGLNPCLLSLLRFQVDSFQLVPTEKPLTRDVAHR